MLRIVLAATALLMASLPAAADQYRDSEGRFTVSVPAGWTAQRPTDASVIALVMLSPIKDEMVASCLVIVRDMPQTARITQSELDDAFSKVLTPDFWKKAFEATGQADATVDDAGNVDRDGRKVYYVVATVTGVDTTGKAAKAKGKQMLHVIPGSMQFVSCTAPQDLYASFFPEFEAVFASYQPKANEFLVKAPEAGVPPSVLTLYTGPKFDGPARVLAQNTPNVPALSGSAVTASVAIAGFGRWEVCDGLNYAGTCRIVTATDTAFDGQAMRIGSVRRYIAPHDPLGAAGIVATTTGMEMRAAAKRVLQGRH